MRWTLRILTISCLCLSPLAVQAEESSTAPTSSAMPDFTRSRAADANKTATPKATPALDASLMLSAPAVLALPPPASEPVASMAMPAAWPTALPQAAQ